MLANVGLSLLQSKAWFWTNLILIWMIEPSHFGISLTCPCEYAEYVCSTSKYSCYFLITFGQVYKLSLPFGILLFATLLSDLSDPAYENHLHYSLWKHLWATYLCLRTLHCNAGFCFQLNEMLLSISFVAVSMYHLRTYSIHICWFLMKLCF